MTITSRAVITGGAGAVGAALAGRLLTAGWEVRSLDLLDPAQAAERHPNLAVHWHQVDVTRSETLHALGDLGSMDALVNSAGYWPRIALEDTTPQQWRAIIEVNLTGTFLVTRHFIPALRAARGCVVNVSSAVALKGEPMLGAYGAAKAGVLGLTKTLARELGRDGVRVNAVAPGLLDTDGNHEYMPTRRSPTPRWVRRWDVGRAPQIPPARSCCSSARTPHSSPAKPLSPTAGWLYIEPPCSRAGGAARRGARRADHRRDQGRLAGAVGGANTNRRRRRLPQRAALHGRRVDHTVAGRARPRGQWHGYRRRRPRRVRGGRRLRRRMPNPVLRAMRILPERAPRPVPLGDVRPSARSASTTGVAGPPGKPVRQSLRLRRTDARARARLGKDRPRSGAGPGRAHRMRRHHRHRRSP